MPEMEVNINSTGNLPSDTINIIFEFTQPGSEEASENEEVILERTGDQVTSVSHDAPAVPTQISSTNDVNCSIRNYATQETLRSDVVEQIQIYVTERKTSEKSVSNSSQLSILNPQQPSISNPQQPSISNPQKLSISNPQQPSISNPPQPSISNPQQTSISNPPQPSISSAQQRPSMTNLRINNGQVVQRVYIQTPVQTDALHNGNTSDSSLKRVGKIGYYKKVEVTANNKPVEGTQITNSTKLALWNFLKKKSAAHVSETNSKIVDDNADPAVQILSTAGESEVSNTCDDNRACSDQLSDIEKDTVNASTRTESQKSVEVVTIAESSSPDPMQSSPNSADKDNGHQPLNQQSDVTGLNAENTDEEIQQADNNTSCTSDCALSNELSTTQEVDVVVLSSLLQPNVSKENVKRKADQVPQQETGIKQKKRKNPRECVECGKILYSTKQFYEHMNIHYDRRPHKCKECGKAFRQSQHLTKHKLLHTGEKPFVCQYCDRAFTTPYARRDHERIHTGEKPCKCTHCGEMFRTASAVIKHEKRFHNLHAKGNALHEKDKRRYTCRVCDKTFSFSSALSEHKKRHQDVRGYKCSKCSKTFINYGALWNHKRTHSKEKPFECDLCGQRLKRRGNLKRHILTQHEPEEAEECLRTSKQFENFRARRKEMS